MFFGPVAPRQLRHGLEVVANDLGFHRLAADPFETGQFAVDFLPSLGRQHQSLQFGPQFVEFVGLIFLAEFFADLLELFPQDHFALPFTQFFLDLRLDLLLSVEDPDLALDLNQNPAKPVLDRQGFEEGLPLGGGYIDVAGYQVGKAPRIVRAGENLLDDLFRKSGLVTQFRRPLADLSIEPDERGILRIERAQLLGIADDCFEASFPFGEVESDGAAFTLEQHLHSGQAPLDLDDSGDSSDGIEPLGIHLLGVFTLAQGQNQLVGGGHGGFNRPNGSGSSGSNRRSDPGKQYQFPKGQDWEGDSFGHGFLGIWGSALGARLRDTAGASVVPCGGRWAVSYCVGAI